MIRWEIVFPAVANAATLVMRWRRAIRGSSVTIPTDASRSNHPGNRMLGLRSRTRSRNRVMRPNLRTVPAKARPRTRDEDASFPWNM